MENIEIEKYLIYNKQNKILIFHGNNKNKIILPTLYLNTDIRNYNQLTQRILEYIENSLYFKTIEKVFLTTVLGDNNKLTKENKKVKKHYFACYHDFTLEEELEIYNMALKEKLIPEFLDIDEILNNKLDINISKYNVEALNHLEKKLTYKMF